MKQIFIFHPASFKEISLQRHLLLNSKYLSIETKSSLRGLAIAESLNFEKRGKPRRFCFPALALLQTSRVEGAVGHNLGGLQHGLRTAGTCEVYSAGFF